MTPEEMKRRTMKYGLRIIKLVESLPSGKVSNVAGYQLLKAGTSVGANYRAACRSRSDADFLARMGIVEEEADESLYRIELLVECGLVKAVRVADLIDEGGQILSIVVASLLTVRARSGRWGSGKAPTRRNVDAQVGAGDSEI